MAINNNVSIRCQTLFACVCVAQLCACICVIQCCSMDSVESGMLWHSIHAHARTHTHHSYFAPFFWISQFNFSRTGCQNHLQNSDWKITQRQSRKWCKKNLKMRTHHRKKKNKKTNLLTFQVERHVKVDTKTHIHAHTCTVHTRYTVTAKSRKINQLCQAECV